VISSLDELKRIEAESRTTLESTEETEQPSSVRNVIMYSIPTMDRPTDSFSFSH